MFLISQVQINGKAPTHRFCFHYGTQTTCNHLNAQSLEEEMETRSTVLIPMERHSVELMICTSPTMPTATKALSATLVTHTNHQQDINSTLLKPSRCLLVATTSHPQKSKYFTEAFFKKRKRNHIIDLVTIFITRQGRSDIFLRAKMQLFKTALKSSSSLRRKKCEISLSLHILGQH